MSHKKYLVVPGWVKSQNDGEMHFVNAPRLMQLYRVSPHECLVVNDRDEAIERGFGGDLLVLLPDPSGRYFIANREDDQDAPQD